MDEQTANKLVKLVAYSLWVKYQEYCPHPLDSFYPAAFQADPEHNFEKDLFDNVAAVQQALDQEYVVQMNKKLAGDDPFDPTDLMPTDDWITLLAQSINIADVPLRLCLELFVKRNTQFQNGIDEAIRSGYFQELAGHFYSDLELLDTANMFSSGETLLGIHRDTDPDSPVKTEGDDGTSSDSSKITTELIEAVHQLTALKTTILALRQYFFDIPVRYEHETRMWRYTQAGVIELQRRRASNTLVISGELKRAIRLNVDLAIGDGCQYMRRAS